MPRVETAALAAAVSLGVARTLGHPPMPPLRDARLGLPDVADEVVSAAAYHGVLPLLWTAVESTPVPVALRHAAHDLYLPLVARDLRLANLLHTVDVALSGADIRYAVYKGPAVARFYPAAGLRMFGDLDVLVAHRDLARVDDALHDAGLHGGWSHVPRDYAETNYVLGSAGALDLHWHVMREWPVRSAFALDTDEMLARAERVAVYDGTALCLDPVDQFLAVATHACYDGAYRLGWLVDIAQLLGSPQVSWDEVRRRCAASRTALPVQVIVDRAVRALGLDASGGSGAPGAPLARGVWRGVLGAVSMARPVERTFRQVGRGGLVFRATRASGGASAAALVRLAVTDALVPLVHDRGHRWRTRRQERI